MDDSQLEQRREFFRLCYPKRAMPDIRLAGYRFHVSEVSEKGLRVLVEGGASFSRGVSITGTLNLHEGRQVWVKGSVLRVEGKEVVLKLSEGPTFKDMVEEQRYMRQNYPSLYIKQTVDIDE